MHDEVAVLSPLVTTLCMLRDLIHTAFVMLLFCKVQRAFQPSAHFCITAPITTSLISLLDCNSNVDSAYHVLRKTIT